jgi:omega-6 fatty acid desaturase (delta-12 desaturase)
MRQRMYRGKYSIALAPFVGFIYLIFNPRFTWFKGTLELVSHVARKKVERPDLSMKVHAASFETRYWQSRKEYWHMFWNNVVLLGVWALMCWAIGAARFFSIYLISLSFAGGVGILLFTVQHNFRHSYASDTQNWDYDAGAIEGTSFLILPRWLNSFTANIGYHHIHHLSARIPNYRLISCHNQNRSSRRAWWLPDPLARKTVQTKLVLERIAKARFEYAGATDTHLGSRPLSDRERTPDTIARTYRVAPRRRFQEIVLL